MKVRAKRNFVLGYNAETKETQYAVDGEVYDITRDKYSELGSNYFEVIKEKTPAPAESDVETAESKVATEKAVGKSVKGK